MRRGRSARPGAPPGRREARSGAADRRPALAAALLAALLLGPPAALLPRAAADLLAPAAAAEDLLLLGQAPRVRRVIIEGNERFSAGDIRSLMTLQTRNWSHPFRGARLYRGQLAQDVQTIEGHYRARGFLRAQVVATAVNVENGVEVRIRVDEGTPVLVTGVDLRGLPDDSRAGLFRSFRTQAGRPLSPYNLDFDRQVLEEFVSDRGHPFARVDENVQFFGNQAVAVFLVEEGPMVKVRSVELTGIEGMNRRGISRELAIHPGDVFSRRMVTRTRQRLYDTGLFNDVQFRVAGYDSAAGEVLLGFDLKKRKQHWFGAGVGYSNSSENLMRLTGEWGSRNILGTGRRLSISGLTARDFLGDRPFFNLREHAEEVSLYEPWLLGTRIHGRLSGFYHYDNVSNAGIRQTSYGSTAAVFKELKERTTNVSLQFEARWVRNEIALSDSARAAACASDPLLCRDRYRTRLLTLSYAYDDRDDFLNPSRGSRHELLLQAAGGPLGGDNNFQKGAVNSSFHSRVGRHSVFSVRVRVGGIHPPGPVQAEAGQATGVEAVPYEDRFFTGGANSVRGYQDNTLNGLPRGKDPTGGGLTELVGNAELRFPIRGFLGGVLFLDAGNVWRDLDRVQLRHLAPTFNKSKTTVEHVRYSLGGGIRFNTPVGPVRLEGAWRLSPSRFDAPRDAHVALGHTF